jgi:hypothetical protein
MHLLHNVYSATYLLYESYERHNHTPLLKTVKAGSHHFASKMALLGAGPPTNKTSFHNVK